MGVLALALATSPVGASAQTSIPVFAGGMASGTGEERVLLHRERARADYCANPIRYDNLQLQSTTTYIAGDDIAAFYRQFLPAPGVPPGTSNPSVAAADVTSVARAIRSRQAGTRTDQPFDFNGNIAILQQAVNEERAAWEVQYQAPILRVSAAGFRTASLVSLANLALGRVADINGCIAASDLLEGTTTTPDLSDPTNPRKFTRTQPTDDPASPTSALADDGLISRLRPAQGRRVDRIGTSGVAGAVKITASDADWVEHFVAADPSRTCWSNFVTVPGTAVAVECAIAVDIPSELEAQQHVGALNVVKGTLESLKSQKGWPAWYKDANKAAYDNLVAETAKVASLWAIVKSDSKTSQAFEKARADLQPWAARLRAIDAVQRSKAGEPYLLSTVVSCEGKQARGKATKVVLSGTDMLAVPPAVAATATEVVTLVCPADASSSYGVGVANREERHFIIAQGRNPGGTSAQSVVDSDVGGSQVPQIGYLGHWSIWGSDGHEVHLTAGPAFSFENGGNPGLFYGLSYSRDRASYLNAGWIVGRVSELIGGYNLGDVVTTDVKTPPTRQTWKRAFTIMLTFPVHGPGNAPQPAPIPKCPPKGPADSATPPSGQNGQGASPPNCVPQPQPQGPAPPSQQTRSETLRASGNPVRPAINPNHPLNPVAAARATTNARAITQKAVPAATPTPSPR